MPLSQTYIQQQILDSIKSNESGDKDLAIQKFSEDLSKIIVEAIKSATIIVPVGGINPSNTTVVAGGFPGTVTSVGPIFTEIS